MDLDQQRGLLSRGQFVVLVLWGIVIHEGALAILCGVLYGFRG